MPAIQAHYPWAAPQALKSISYPVQSLSNFLFCMYLSVSIELNLEETTDFYCEAEYVH